VRPTIGRDVFIAPTAVLIGDVRVGDRANIWFGAVLRADFSHIVGPSVIVGHGAILEGCVIEEGGLVGMGAIVCQRARLGAGAMLAAGAVLSERSEIAPGMLAAGVPASEKKELSGSAKGWTENAAAHYQELRERYIDNLEETSATDADWRRAASRGR